VDEVGLVAEVNRRGSVNTMIVESQSRSVGVVLRLGPLFTALDFWYHVAISSALESGRSSKHPKPLSLPSCTVLLKIGKSTFIGEE
jgi:hypothetical protein